MNPNSALNSNEITNDIISRYNYKDEIQLCCFICSKQFIRYKNHLLQNLKRNRKTTCSRSCASKLQNEKYKNKTNIKCSFCFKEFHKKRHLILKHKNHYCSSDCMKKSRARKDIKIEDKVRKASLEGVTKGELFKRRKNWQSARSSIQRHARLIFDKSSEEKSCRECGYSKHYEVCHINDVSSFSSDILITEINNIQNLIALCPNHHWEFDNNHLILKK